MIAHRYWRGQRVTKADSKDGKTEWFVVSEDEVLEGMNKLIKALHFIYDDKLVWAPP